MYAFHPLNGHLQHFSVPVAVWSWNQIRIRQQPEQKNAEDAGISGWKGYIVFYRTLMMKDGDIKNDKVNFILYNISMVEMGKEIWMC